MSQAPMAKRCSDDMDVANSDDQPEGMSHKSDIPDEEGPGSSDDCASDNDESEEEGISEDDMVGIPK